MHLQLDGRLPAYRQIHTQLRQAIRQGALAAGTQLPASRRLARQLGVARITIVQAYEQLQAEGYLETRPGRGTFVASAFHNLAVSAAGRSLPAEPPALSSFARRAAQCQATLPPGRSHQALPFDFQYGLPHLPAISQRDWRRALRAAADKLPTNYPEAAGDEALRTALASHLRRHRGISVRPQQLIIVSGTQQALDLIGRCLLSPGEIAVLEQPHYRGARQVFQCLGAVIHTVPVDAYGAQTDCLNALPDQARLFCLTPSHQFPLGGVLPAARRMQALQWAGARGAYLIEDDYDSEYRYTGPPLQSLFEFDGGRRVIYVGSLSKVMFPGLRLGYIAAGEALIASLRELKWLADRGTGALEQAAMAKFIQHGAFHRHIQRCSRLLAARRQALVAALHEHFGAQVEIIGADSGMHLVLRLPDHQQEQTELLIHCAAQSGVGVYSTQPYYLDASPSCAEFLLGYATLTPEAIGEGVAQLVKSWSASPR